MTHKASPCHPHVSATLHSAHPLRFRCRECGRTFSARFGEKNYASKLSLKTLNELQTELDKGLSVRQIARMLKLSPSTVFRWKNFFETSNPLL